MNDELRAKLAAPNDVHVVSINYSLGQAEASYLDLAFDDAGVEGRLRFLGTRVVQFADQLPAALLGLEVVDVEPQEGSVLTLWVSVGQGAVTFWARALAELRADGSIVRAEIGEDTVIAPRTPAPLMTPSMLDEQGVPSRSFEDRGGEVSGGTLRAFTFKVR